MDINYQKELEKFIDLHKDENIKLLLHSCCAPCSSYVIEYLSKFFPLTVYFYNPNIESYLEFEKRAKEQIRLISCLKTDNPVDFVIEKYDSMEFLSEIKGYENEPERGGRCSICFDIRLRKTMEYAKKNNYKYFLTTLTLSPLKNQKVINKIGEELCRGKNVIYIPSDFKKKGGYLRSLQLSKNYELYRQNYCGCVFSKNK